MWPLSKGDLQRLEIYRENLPRFEFDALQFWVQTFWPFQRGWLLEPARRAFGNKSRQIGLSHTTAGICDIWGAFHGEVTTVISIGQREADEVIDKCRKHQEVLIGLGSKMAMPPKGKRPKAGEVQFASGGKIISLPSSGGRSFTGNVFLDEFAYYEHPQAVWDAAMAVSMLGFRSRIASTPNGVGNDFHELVTKPEINRGWVGHEIPIDIAIAAGFPVNMQDCWTLAKGDPRIFAQLFKCSFLDGEFQYFPTQMIEDCGTFVPMTLGGGRYYAGLDIGKSVDRSVLTVVQKVGTLKRLVYIEECKRTSYDALHAMVDRAFRAFDIQKLVVDSTGLGSFEADRMRDRLGYYKVEPLVFSLASKEMLATSLFSAFANKEIQLPARDEVFPPKPRDLPGSESGAAIRLKKDLCSIRREVTTAGNVRYDAPHTAEGHADSAWSLMMAVHASSFEVARGNIDPSVGLAL